MAKSIIIKRAEFSEELVDLVNNTDLPAFVIRGVLDDLRATILQVEEAEYRDEMEAWVEQNMKAEVAEDECP